MRQGSCAGQPGEEPPGPKPRGRTPGAKVRLMRGQNCTNQKNLTPVLPDRCSVKRTINSVKSKSVYRGRKMKTNMKANMKDTVKMHPISTALFIIYFIISVLQGNTDLLIAGCLAASAAWALELIFCVTGMIRTGRCCAGRSSSCRPHPGKTREGNRYDTAS